MQTNQELKQCSKCHSTKLPEYFGTNVKGELFKTCINCRTNCKNIEKHTKKRSVKKD